MTIRKLSTVIVVSMVSINALFIIGITLIAYKIFVDFTSQEISQARLALLNESTQKATNFIMSVSDAGIYIATNRNVLRMFSEPSADAYDSIVEQRTLTDIMNGIMTFKRDLHSIVIYTDRYENGPYVAEGLVFPLRIVKDELWFSLFDTMDSGWISAHTDALFGDDVVSYVHRLINQQGKTVGYVKVNMKTDTFIEYLQEEIQYDAEVQEELILIDPRGRIIIQSHADSSIVLEELAEPDPFGFYMRLREPYMRLSNSHQMLKFGNDTYLMLISKPAYERWKLIQLVPIDALYAETRNMGWYVVLLGMVGLLLSIPLSWWIGKKLIVPIRRIIQGMKHVETGNFDVRMDTEHTIEEYAILAQKFNHMTMQLDELMYELEKESQAKREAEIKMLQSQITPHFLYNTLDIIHWRAMDLKDEKISMMVNQLSKMFRIGLSGGKKMIPLRDELEHVRCYVNIQRAQHRRKIDFIVDMPPSLKALYVPKIILQPFVENSMRHGYPDLHQDVIEIRLQAEIVEEDQTYLEIRIEDNGIGFPPDWNMAEAKGIGIQNVQERIQMYCGSQYGIQLSNAADGGARVQIRLPVIRNEQEARQWSEGSSFLRYKGV